MIQLISCYCTDLLTTTKKNCVLNRKNMNAQFVCTAGESHNIWFIYLLICSVNGNGKKTIKPI